MSPEFVPAPSPEVQAPPPQSGKPIALLEEKTWSDLTDIEVVVAKVVLSKTMLDVIAAGMSHPVNIHIVQGAYPGVPINDRYAFNIRSLLTHKGYNTVIPRVIRQRWFDDFSPTHPGVVRAVKMYRDKLITDAQLVSHLGSPDNLIPREVAESLRTTRATPVTPTPEPAPAVPADVPDEIILANSGSVVISANRSVRGTRSYSTNTRGRVPLAALVDAVNRFREENPEGFESLLRLCSSTDLRLQAIAGYIDNSFFSNTDAGLVVIEGDYTDDVGPDGDEDDDPETTGFRVQGQMASELAEILHRYIPAFTVR